LVMPPAGYKLEENKAEVAAEVKAGGDKPSEN